MSASFLEKLAELATTNFLRGETVTRFRLAQDVEWPDDWPKMRKKKGVYTIFNVHLLDWLHEHGVTGYSAAELRQQKWATEMAFDRIERGIGYLIKEKEEW